jgi:two-component system sensor kinase FixL
MKGSKGVIGVLSLASPEVIRVDDGFLEMATELANHVASLIERTRAEAWLQSLIDTTQDAVISIDRQGRVVLFNPSAERIFGYTKAEIQGQKVNLLMAEPYASEHDNYIAPYEQTGEQRAIGRILTVEARRKNGEIFPIELSITEVTSDESEKVHYAAFIRDVSEKAWLQEQFIESSRLAAIGTTAAKFAHEVANPLNGMSLTAQRLERHLAGQPCYSDPAVQSTLRRLGDEISRLTHLLNDFRSLSRREQYTFQLTALTAIAAEILAMEAENYAGKGVRVEQHLPPNLPLVQADRDKLKQALWNLCKNAVEAMPQGGTLTLSAYRCGADVVLEIGDTGIGIPPGVDIFEPFTTTKSSGSGLGLVVVRQIVAAHGGNITYTREPSKGTTFRLVLPQAALEHQLAAP